MQNKVAQSETVVLKRSQITPSDYNPRKLSKEAKAKLTENIKENGLIGGLVYNEVTGNLVSGHQRLAIADEINKYNPKTKKNDYDIKLEKISVDSKKEKELNIWFNSSAGQGEYDYKKLALIVPDIDTTLAGLTDIDLSNIAEVTVPLEVEVPKIDVKVQTKAKKEPKQEEIEIVETNEINETEEPKKEVKAKVKESIGEPYFTLSFNSYENKVLFLERFAIDGDIRFLKGEELNSILDKLLQ